MAKLRTVCIATLLLCATAGGAGAATVAYTSQSDFQAAFPGSFRLVNLDAPPLSGFPSGYHVEDAGPAAAFAAQGIDFFGFDAQVFDEQNYQTPTDRDWLIFNGNGFGGEIGVNFATPVYGVGALANVLDFGRIRLFSGADLSGSFIDEVQFGPGGFGGLTSTGPIGSAQFTCDFNEDLKCGVFDIQFGTAPAVPEPRTWALMLCGLGLVGAALRWRRSKPPRGITQ